MHTDHEIMGMVTHVDAGTGDVRLKQDSQDFCTLCCGDATRISGEEPLVLASLQPGDYIRSECRRDAGGRLLASRIVLLRPAWRFLESPET